MYFDVTGEIELYDDPYDYYGRLIMDAFLTSRLVVDTGMNALGWSWEDTQNYMREHTFCTDAEIASNTLRYSCGIPAQSLACKLEDEEILRMRRKMQEKLGEAYSHKDFHSDEAMTRETMNKLQQPVVQAQCRPDEAISSYSNQRIH